MINLHFYCVVQTRWIVPEAEKENLGSLTRQSIQDSLGVQRFLYEVISEINDQELLFKLAELVEHHVFIIGKESCNRLVRIWAGVKANIYCEACELQRDMIKMWVNQLKIHPDKKPTTMPFQLWRAPGKDLEEQYGKEDPQTFKQS